MAKSSDQSEVRGSWKQILAGKIVAFFMRLLGLTLKFRIEDPDQQRGKYPTGTAVIYAFWHNCLFVAPLTKKHFAGNHTAKALTSASKDGAIIASLVKCFGVEPVRGSSSRRAVAALVALKKALKNGDQLFITPDGPRGPRYHLQPGVIKLAQSSAAPIITVRFHFSSCWKLKSWDHFRIPKPFSTITLTIDKALKIPRTLSDDEFESWRDRVERQMNL